MCAVSTGTSDVRSAAVAGRFYPRKPAELRELVKDLLDGAEKKGPTMDVRAAMVPHAGLKYSGACAAHVFKQVTIPEQVIIIGPNHFGALGSAARASVWQHGAFATPIGSLPIEKDLADELVRTCALVGHDPVAHEREHSIEVQLPFLLTLKPEAKILPILLAWDDWARCRELAGALAQLMAKRPDVLLLASSDMTHYESAKSARRKDEIALEAIERLDGRGLLVACRRKKITMCGRAAVATVMETIKQLGGRAATVIDYRHSGMVTGDDDDVVSYAAAVIA